MDKYGTVPKDSMKREASLPTLSTFDLLVKRCLENLPHIFMLPSLSF